MTDTMPRAAREPIFNLPRVVLACCLVLLGLHGLYVLASNETKDAVIENFAFVPARMAIALDVAQGQVRAAVQNMPQEMFRQLIGEGGGRWWTLVTYALLHGSWAHVGLNCVWLAAFGAPVARRFGAARFLLLLLVAALAGVLVQFAADMASFMPVIGASAAVAGAMGAAVRFVFRPAGEPMAVDGRDSLDETFRRPALSLLQVATTRTALVFVVFWFVTNLVFGLYPSLGGMGDAPIAWQAHIGGFLAGLLLFPLIDPRPPPIEGATVPPIEDESPVEGGAGAA